jgi:hypothetical protein
MFIKRIFFAAALLLTTASIICAQEALKSTEEEYYDFLALEGVIERPSLGYRTLSDSVWNVPDDADGNVWAGNNLGTAKKLTDHISFKLYGPDWYNSFNTASPYGQNDGALWQGKGYNTSLTAGARLEAYGFEVTIKPMVCFSQNLEFDYMPSAYESEYGYFWKSGGSIDYPQRFGDEPFFTFDWGDTEIRYTWKTLTIGFGTQSPWLGPAWLNPMLGSNNAATYPKLDLGIRKTSIYLPWLHWYIGDIEARLWTGMLTESDYFDSDSSNDHNMINALSVSFAPSFIPGLTLGANRVFLTKWEWENLKYIGRLFTLSKGNTAEDQKISLTADWLFSKVGLELYGELGIDDYANASTILDYIKYPFHTMDYTVGLKKTIPIIPKYNIYSELIFEWNNFEMSQDFQLQWEYMGFYSHSIITQGYTNRGQILGAGSGSMGNSQYLGLNVYYPKGKAEIFVHRTNPDNNYIYSKAVYEKAGVVISETGKTLEMSYFSAFKATWTMGISNEYFITKDFSISGGYAFEIIVNPLYQNGLFTEYNNIIQSEIKYRF